MLKAAAPSFSPRQTHAGLCASTTARCLCAVISCTDAQDKYSFLPACVAMRALLELPGHAWTPVVAAKEGGKICAWIQQNLPARLWRAQHNTHGVFAEDTEEHS